jgi:polysaccharide export outer membrane protein
MLNYFGAPGIRKLTLLCTFLVGPFVCPSFGQMATPATPAIIPAAQPGNSSNPQPQGIVVGPGDSIHIIVYDVPELEQRVTVNDHGNVNLALVGDVHVADMTATEVGRKLEELLTSGRFLVHPSVNVTIEQSAAMQVSVLGEVKNPGNYEIETSRNVLDILSLAGGLTDAASRNITIKRRVPAGATSAVFVPNNADDAIEQSTMVYPGDIVIVPKAGLVYVLGDVGRPGGYYMQRDSQLSVLQAVTMAGGVLPNAAAPHARIVRKTSTGYTDIPLPLRDIQNGKKPDVQLEADDVIYVPFSYGRNMFIQSSSIMASAASALIYVH